MNAAGRWLISSEGVEKGAAATGEREAEVVKRMVICDKEQLAAWPRSEENKSERQVEGHLRNRLDGRLLAF